MVDADILVSRLKTHVAPALFLSFSRRYLSRKKKVKNLRFLLFELVITLQSENKIKRHVFRFANLAESRLNSS